MPYAVHIATPEDRTLVVAALRAGADQRVRVARKASGGVAVDKRASKDVRSAAVKVAMILAEANTLETLAAELEAAEEVAVIRVAADGSLELPDPDLTDEAVAVSLGEDPNDDGLSPEAQAAAELAGLTPADPDAVEDALGRLPEDLDVDDAEVEEVLSR